jgi:CheY-like chemotaxis protein
VHATSHTRELAQAGGVLVIDDEWAIRRVVVRCLSDAGHRVWEASSGAEALEVAAREGDAISVALVDINMDGMGGFESAVRLRATIPRLSVVYMTGDERAVHLQARAPVLRKPFTPQQLRATVRGALEREGPAAS